MLCKLKREPVALKRKVFEILLGVDRMDKCPQQTVTNSAPETVTSPTDSINCPNCEFACPDQKTVNVVLSNCSNVSIKM